MFMFMDRVACWTFLADGFLTVCFKNHPQLTIFEMDCDFPWSTELFETENVSSFNDVVATQTTGPSLPTLRKVAESLLQMPSSTNRIPWDRSLSVEHLLMLIYGMHTTPSRYCILIWADSNELPRLPSTIRPTRVYINRHHQTRRHELEQNLEISTASYPTYTNGYASFNRAKPAFGIPETCRRTMVAVDDYA